jgi:heme-degrading monooxygenase HmoA
VGLELDATEINGEVLTVFRSRLRDEARTSYAEIADSITELARSMPGFVDVKTFVADDGERVTIVTFANRAAHDAWRDHPEHEAVKRRGVAEFYAEYSVQVAEVMRSHTWRRGDPSRLVD